MAKDPICGMEVAEYGAVKAVRDGKEYFFCGVHCRDKFIQQEGLKEDAAACHPLAKRPFFRNKLFIVIGASLLLITASFFIPFFTAFRNAFLTYLRIIWLAVALGLFLGGLIDYYVPREYVSKILARKSAFTVFNAVFLGFLMSACSHGILALSIQLYKKGASVPAVVSFLLASPWANLTITVMLVSFFGLKGLFIIIAAIVVALNTGFIFMFLEKKNLIEKNKNTLAVSEDFSILSDLGRRVKNYKFGLTAIAADLKGIIKGALALSDMVLWWIILGLFIASLAGAYIPAHFFHKFMGPTFGGIILTLLFAAIIEVCSEGSSPLAFEIYHKTGALGNSFVFLMAGVATDYTEIGLLWTNIGRRTAIWLPVIAVPQIIAIGYFANIIFT